MPGITPWKMKSKDASVQPSSPALPFLSCGGGSRLLFTAGGTGHQTQEQLAPKNPSPLLQQPWKYNFHLLKTPPSAASC